NIFAAGLTVYLVRTIYGLQDVGHVVPAEALPTWDVPLLSAIPFIGKVVFQQNVVVDIALIVLVLVEIVFVRTLLGLRLAAVGQHPQAADPAGLTVHVLRYG